MTDELTRLLEESSEARRSYASIAAAPVRGVNLEDVQGVVHRTGTDRVPGPVPEPARVRFAQPIEDEDEDEEEEEERGVSVGTVVVAVAAIELVASTLLGTSVLLIKLSSSMLPLAVALASLACLSLFAGARLLWRAVGRIRLL